MAEGVGGPVGNPVRTLLARGSLYTIATAVQTSATILVLPAITRVLSPAEYGTVAAAVIVLTIVGILGRAGIPSAISLDWFEADAGPERARGLVSTTFALATAVALLLEITGPLWSEIFDGVEYGAALRIAVWGSVFAAVTVAVQGIMLSDDRPAEFLTTAILSTAVGQALGLVFVAVLDWGAAGYLGGLAIGFGLAALYGVWRTGLSTRGLKDRPLVTSALAVGLPTVPHSLSLYLLAAGDRVVIERIEGLDAVGRYQVAYLIGALGIYLLAAANNAWGRLVYGAQDEDRRADVLAQTTAALYPLAAIVAGGIALLAPVALVVAAPGDYEPLALTPVTAIVALSVVPYVGYLSNVHLIFWRRKTGVLGWSTPLAAAVNVALTVALVPVIGLAGAALATVVSYAGQALLVRRARIKLQRVPWRAGVATRAWLGGGALVAAGALLPPDGVWLVLRIAGGLVLLAAFAVTVRRVAAHRPELATQR